MYTVTFKRRDNQPDEVYYYINLFKEDDSELYERIELLQFNRNIQMQIDVINFIYQ